MSRVLILLLSAILATVAVARNPRGVSVPVVVTGVWTNVTPAGVDPVSCTNAGARTVQADPAHASNLYTEFDCYGIWKSVDYGLTWTGPLNTGSNSTLVGDCEGGISIAPGSTATPPTIYLGCIRRSGVGFWKSTDGGVNWTNYNVAPGGSRQDYLSPSIDPYDVNHLVMTGHEFDSTVESTDGGLTWTAVPLNSGMLQSGGSSFIFFLNTGSSTTTRTTWLWLGGSVGTWRTTNSGTTWTQVDNNRAPSGSAQIYQPDTSGIVFMAGLGSASGDGVVRSTNYGVTWAHVGLNNGESIVDGTVKNVYALYGQSPTPNYELAVQPGTGTWTSPTLPSGLNNGAQFAIVNNGSKNVLVGAMWQNGMWRYIEP